MLIVARSPHQLKISIRFLMNGHALEGPCSRASRNLAIDVEAAAVAGTLEMLRLSIPCVTAAQVRASIIESQHLRVACPLQQPHSSLRDVKRSPGLNSRESLLGKLSSSPSGGSEQSKPTGTPSQHRDHNRAQKDKNDFEKRTGAQESDEEKAGEAPIENRRYRRPWKNAFD